MKRVLSLLLLFFLSNLLVVASSSSTIMVDDVVIVGIGNMGTTNITLDSLPEGLSGYNISISLNNASVVTIASVSFPSWATLHSNSSMPASSIWLKAADLDMQVESGATNVLLATLLLESIQIGETSINISIMKLDDDGGYPIAPAVQNVTATVVQNQPPNEPSNPNPTNKKPIADASAGEPYWGSTGSESITFNGSNSYDPDGNITSWYWEFGDGSNGTGETIAHGYAEPREYTVTLTVTDNDGDKHTCETTAVITQPNKPPSNLSIDGPRVVGTNVEYTYTATSTDLDNDTLRYVFNWRDGTTSTTEYAANNTAVNATHTWDTAGLYIVSVYAEDEQNATSEIVELMVLVDVDVTYIDDEITGYLLDYHRNGTFTEFHNNETGVETAVEQQEDGSYLIDSNDDGEWDYTYTRDGGLQSYRKEKEKEEEPLIPGFEFVFVLIAVTMLILLRWKKRIP